MFGQPAHLWRKIIVRACKLETAFCWGDNNLIVKERTNPTTIDDIVKLSDEMRVSSNPEKVHKFADEKQYISFIWNAKKRTVRLPTEKLKERRQQVIDFLAPRAAFFLKDVDKFVGRLVHTCNIVPNLQCCMPSL